MSQSGIYFITHKAARFNSWIRIFNGQKKMFSSSFTKPQEYQTMDSVTRNLSNKLKADSKISHNLLKHFPKSQKDLPVRKMKETFDEAIIPLSTDVKLRKKYLNAMGGVRFGRVMEDLDTFAAYLSARYITYPDLPPDAGRIFAIVTISISTEIKGTFEATSDIRVSGYVNWVGRSSLEIFIWMDQAVSGKWNRILKASVMMAAKNAINNGPAVINAIEGETEEEKNFIRDGEERRKKRLQSSKQSLLTTIPTAEEFSLIHTLFTKTLNANSVFLHDRILPPKSKWMHESVVTTTLLCHPENRNLHDKIFGGFLIRQATELSWIAAVKYGFRIPTLIQLSDVTFYHPVDVGSLLNMFALVTFTEKQYAQVSVYAETQALSAPTKSTTSFNFTYEFTDPIDQVYPSTYLDAMRFIDGRRRFLHKNHPLPDRKRKGEFVSSP